LRFEWGVVLTASGEDRTRPDEVNADVPVHGRGPSVPHRAPASPHRPTQLIGQSAATVRLISRIRTMASSDAPVLIDGESGTGKELVARMLHEQGPRAPHPFVAVNCAAFPETLLEAELFGHERGAFTGASRVRHGRFKAADSGTLFLDEIGETPQLAQVKLLRVLERGEFEPLGSTKSVNVDVRLISATHRDLKKCVHDKTFREDLYYRLNVLDIHVPPLRERRDDILVLIEYFLRIHTPPERSIPRLSPGAWAVLTTYDFPGNVRELEHAIERAVVLAQGLDIEVTHLPEDMTQTCEERAVQPLVTFPPLGEAAKEFEREYIRRALQIVENRKAQAAALLGISRKTLWEKLREHGL
jgi:DNA-binding NtrC family response regulator